MRSNDKPMCGDGKKNQVDNTGWLSLTDERRLARQLKQDAALEAPQFSHALHERVMSAVRAADGDTRESRRADRFTPRRWWRYSAAAAILLAALGLWRVAAWTAGPGVNALTEQRETVVSPVVANGATASRSADVSIEELNHGAAVALRLVVDRAPIELPADDWGLPKVE